MDHEIELKFLIAPESTDEILSHLQGDGAIRQLDATYFDTEGHVLRKAGFGLRVRDGEGGRKQTLKSASAGGVFARGEWETVIAGPGPDDAALAATPAADVLAGQALKPVFTTRVERTVRMIRQGETVIEAVIDRGELIAEGRRAAVCELELELKSGQPSALFDLARHLAERVPLRLSLVSKAERGYGLVTLVEAGPPRRAAPVLSPDMSVKQALQAIGREALSHLCGAVETLRDRPGPEGVHQLRVALRRTRALLKAFKPLANDPTAKSLVEDLKWLAGELDLARDLDVFVADVWRPALDREPAIDMAAFGRALLAAQTAAYLRMEAALESPRQRRLLLELAAWLEMGPSEADPTRDAMRNGPAPSFAAELLSGLRKSVVRRGARLDQMDREGRHRLRLKGKTLRYAAEDLSSLFPDHALHATRFIDAARSLQDRLGRLNDQAARTALAHQIALASGDPEAAFAAGRLTAGASDPDDLSAAVKAYDALRQARTFW